MLYGVTLAIAIAGTSLQLLLIPLIPAGTARCNWRRGRDSNPREASRPLAVFKTAAFNRSATPPRATL
jgi:hypothetical protein